MRTSRSLARSASAGPSSPKRFVASLSPGATAWAACAELGVRRAGKTTFLHQLRNERLAGGAARARVPYVNFEDERLAGLDGRQLGFLLEEYGRRVPDASRAGPVLWFDEIQAVPGWERFVRRLPG